MFDKIKALIVENLDVDPELVTEDAQFMENLKLNSLELADLVVLCEEETGIEIEEEDIHTLLTVGDLVRYVESKQA